MKFNPDTHLAHCHPVHYGAGDTEVKYRVQILEKTTSKVVFERVFQDEGPAKDYVENHRKGNG